MKSRTIIRSIIRTILFFIILHFVVWWLGVTMVNLCERIATADFKMSYDYSQYYFGRAPRDSYDTVFIGSSHQFCTVDVNLLNHEYGMNSILLSSSAQNMKLSYFAAMEAIELQHPDVIVLEMTTITNEEEEPNRIARWSFLNLMPNLTRSKAAAVKAIGEDFYLYYYPLTALHSNWPKLHLKDFKLPPRLAPGECYRYSYDRLAPQTMWEILPPEEKAPMTEPAQRWLDQIVALCESEGVRLILYTTTFPATEREQRIYNGAADYAAAHGLAYYNLIHDTEKIGIDPALDFMDDTHLNGVGQEKVTRWLAEQGMVC